MIPGFQHSRGVALLSDPIMRARIVRAVRKRVANEDAVEDIVQQAFSEACSQQSRLPNEDGAAKRYLFGIVRNKIRMHIRDWTARAQEQFDEELHGTMEPAPFKARWMVRQIAEGVEPSHWQAFTWFVRVTLGDSLSEIAREAGVDYSTAHKRYTRMRDDLRRRANQLPTTVAIVLLAFFILRALRPHSELTATPDVAPPPSAVVQNEPSSKEQATELRQAAFAACDAGRWGECQWRLDEARRLDAAGDTAADVQAAWTAARNGLERNTKAPARDVK